MKLRFLVLFLLFFPLFFGEAKAQAPEETAELHIIVLYDGNHDGEEEGVGSGVAVYIRESGSTQEFVNLTDHDSSAGFLVFPRSYFIHATPRQTRLFFTWVCDGFVQVDEEKKFHIVHCIEKFFIRIPSLWD